MSIDYYVQYPCKVRQLVTDQDLLRMEKARNRAHAVLSVMRDDPGTDRTKPEAEWAAIVRVIGPNGPVDQPVKISAMLAEADPLSSLSEHCRGCDANLTGRSFGCGGAVNFPISEEDERWLLARLPSVSSDPAFQLLIRAVSDFKFDGSPIDDARHRRDLYVLAKPLKRTWGRFFFKKTKITSSQILQMFFFVGSLQPTHARLCAYFLGFLNDEMRPATRADNQAAPVDSARVIQFKQFLAACSFAGTNNLNVFIDA